MAVEYTYQLRGVMARDTADRQNVVEEVQLVLIASDGTNTLTSLRPVIIDPPSDTFVEYSDVTKDQLITWAKDKLGADEISDMKNGLASGLADLADPNTKNPLKRMTVPS